MQYRVEWSPVQPGQCWSSECWKPQVRHHGYGSGNFITWLLALIARLLGSPVRRAAVLPAAAMSAGQRRGRLAVKGPVRSSWRTSAASDPEDAKNFSAHALDREKRCCKLR